MPMRPRWARATTRSPGLLADRGGWVKGAAYRRASSLDAIAGLDCRGARVLSNAVESRYDAGGRRVQRAVAPCRSSPRIALTPGGWGVAPRSSGNRRARGGSKKGDVRMRQFANLLLTLLATVALAPAGVAQDAGKYPEQMVRMVVPFSAGSMTDLLARVVAEKLQQRWNKEVVVENRPGLAGTASVAKATPDGYTLMLSSNGHTVIGHLNKNLAFDPVRDFVGVTQVAITPLILVVPPDCAPKNVKELVDLARSKPGDLIYSSAGLGSTTGIAGALFRQTTKTEIVHLPFKGLPETHTAIIRGDVAMGFSFFAAAGDL